MSSESNRNSSSSNTPLSTSFKILVASDIHLGYYERHHLRGNDSFDSFEEVLQAASKHNVDFILLAGDLFHVNKPPMATINRAIELIRKYCFGEPDSDPCNPRFKISNFKKANFLDPNLRVKFPIFTIHGNHDDPSGVDQTSVIDLLASSGLVNYLGKMDKVDEVLLSPVILRKGPTKIAIYGLGSMHEERLANIFRSNRFNYLQPDDPSSYLKIMVVHQNRVPHPRTKYLDPDDLEDLPDLVVWGHEHECIARLDYHEPQKFYILQPGSTVATSLSDSEVPPKHYSILSVGFDELTQHPKMKINFHRLQTARPFAMETHQADEIVLMNRDGFRTHPELIDHLQSFCRNQIEQMIATLEAECTTSKPMLPLIRLRILYSEPEHYFDPKSLEQEFDDRVANSEEMIRFVKRNKSQQTQEAFVDYGQDFEIDEMMDMLNDEVMQKQMQVSNVMDAYFENLPEKDQMTLFSHKYLNEQVVDYVQKENTDPLPEILLGYQAVVKDKLTHMFANDAVHFDVIDLKKQIRAVKHSFEESSEARRKLDQLIHDRVKGKKTTKGKKKTDDWGDDEEDEDDNHSDEMVLNKRSRAKKALKDSDEDDEVVKPAPKPRGRGRAAAATSFRGRGRPKKQMILDDDEDD